MCFCLFCLFFFFKQKTAYEMRISDWSSDVCSSDLQHALGIETVEDVGEALALLADPVLLGNEQAVDEDRIGVDRLAPHLRDEMDVDRSEERRVGKECVSTCRSRWSPYH